MRRKAARTIGIVLVLMVVAVIAIPIWLGYRTYHQAALDRDLISAVKRDDGVGVRRLLEQGASANVTNAPVQHQSLWQCIVTEAKLAWRRRRPKSPKPGDSALAIAVAKNSTEIARLLLEHGAKGVNDEVNTAGQYGQPMPLLVVAAENTNAAILGDLIIHGADVNKPGTSVLFLLKSNYVVDIAELGMDPTTETNNPRGSDFWSPRATPLMLSVDHGGFDLDAAKTQRFLACLTLLIQHGARVGAKDGGGSSALTYASYLSTPAVIRFLIRHGAHVNPNEGGGDTLCWAAFRGRDDNIKALLDAGANPNLSAPFGYTPLILAARIDDETAVRELLDHGARINYKNENGHTALDVAVYDRRWEVVKLLKQRGGKTTGKPFGTNQDD